MTYTSLVAPKGTTGSIANWVNYSKLDLPAVVDEAQSLLFSLLRIREMRKEWTFGMAVGEAQIALPARFLDPIGRLHDITNGIRMPHRIETDIVGARVYEATSGDFAADPFTTVNGSSSVAVELAAHDLTQGSTLTILLATAVGGLTLNGTFPVTSITDDDNLVIDVDEFATSGATGGGAAAEYTANKLISGSPSSWTIFDEQVKFDCAFDTATQFKQLYFRAPLPLAATTNESNWLTSRYPKLMRVACSASAADYMKDDAEYQKHLASLTALVQSTNAESDLTYRGAEFGTDTPTPGDYY